MFWKPPGKLIPELGQSFDGIEEVHWPFNIENALDVIECDPEEFLELSAEIIFK